MWLIFVILLSFQAFGDDLCGSALGNTNGLIPAADYRRQHTRNLYSYRILLGPEFREAIDSGKQPLVWIDSGAGFGIAGLEAAIGGRATVYAINAQNFWEALKDGHIEHKIVRVIGSSLGVSLDGIPVIRKSDESVLGKMFYLSWSKVEEKHYAILRARLYKMAKSSFASGRFNYLPGFSETVLPQFEGQADILTDPFGAFFYSAKRMSLLDLYIEKLKPGGVGIVILRTEKGVGADDRVLFGKNQSVALIQDLIQRYPQVFSLSSGKGSENLLIIRKPKDLKPLNLAKIYRAASVHMIPFEDTEFPQVDWAR